MLENGSVNTLLRQRMPESNTKDTVWSGAFYVAHAKIK
jgi:hypothetical protein